MNVCKQQWLVTIYSANKNDKVDEFSTAVDDLKDAVRMVLRYVPKRGYEVFKYDIEIVPRLV